MKIAKPTHSVTMFWFMLCSTTAYADGHSSYLGQHQCTATGFTAKDFDDDREIPVQMGATYVVDIKAEEVGLSGTWQVGDGRVLEIVHSSIFRVFAQKIHLTPGPVGDSDGLNRPAHGITTLVFGNISPDEIGGVHTFVSSSTVVSTYFTCD